MLTAPTSGDIYFPADTVDDLTSATPATFIGTYSVTLPNLGVSDLEFYDFEYYPNPVRDVLNISSQQVIAQVDIYNMLGQNVSVQKLNALEGTVNTTSLSTGTYFLRTTFKDGTTGTFKLVKE